MRHNEISPCTSADDVFNGLASAAVKVQVAFAGAVEWLVRVSKLRSGVSFFSHIEGKSFQRTIIELHPIWVGFNGGVQGFPNDVGGLSGTDQCAGDDLVKFKLAPEKLFGASLCL